MEGHFQIQNIYIIVNAKPVKYQFTAQNVRYNRFVFEPVSTISSIQSLYWNLLLGS